MKNLIYLLKAVVFLSVLGCEGDSTINLPQERPPNIIILLADDLGYGDLSCYGSQSLHTPHLDSLAANGMRFARFYAGSAVCTPSRASLLTGKFPLRFNITRHFSDSTEHLPPGTPTLPEMLRTAGYATAHIGKWHLGGLRPIDYESRQKGLEANPGPLQHGFDHSLTNIEGAPIRPRLIRERKLYREGGRYLVRNDRHIAPIEKHWTEIKVDEAIHLLDSWKENDQPFFLNLWFDVPHTPYEPAPEPHLSRYQQMGVTGEQLYFRSMVSHLDAQIGRLIRHLKKNGLYDNTLIFFTSDNGPAYQGSPGPFKGGKTDLHEGGIRVPMFAVWPQRIPANTYAFQTAHMVDLLPTVAEAAGVSVNVNEPDGISILPVLTGQGKPVDRGVLLWQMDLYRHFQNQGPKPEPYITAVATKGTWKMTFDSLTARELFNLTQDHRELYNLLGEQPAVEAELRAALEDFFAAPRRSWEE